MKTSELELLAKLAGAMIGSRLPLPGESLIVDGVRFDLRELYSAKQAAQTAITEEVANHGIHRTQAAITG